MQVYSRWDDITLFPPTSSPFTQNIFSELSSNQQRVAIVAVVAAAIFTVLYFAYRHFFAHQPSLQSPPSQRSFSPTPVRDSQGSYSQDDDWKIDKVQDVWQKTVDSPSSSPSSVQSDEESDSEDSASPILKVNDYFNKYSVPKKYTDPIPSYKPPTPFYQPPAPLSFQVKHPVVNAPLFDPDHIHKPDPVLDPLIGAEMGVDDIREELKLEKEILTVLLNEVKDGSAEVSDVEDQRVKIEELETQLDKALLAYPKVLNEFLVNRFNSHSDKRDHQEIYQHVVKLGGFMNAYNTNEPFLLEGLSQIDLFLGKTFFNSPNDSTIQEEKKVDLVVFNAFFEIADAHFNVVIKLDPVLAYRLKVRLANLPLVDGKEYLDRTDFKNIYLDEAEQRRILIAHFEEEEDRAVDHAIDYIKKPSLDKEDVKMLSKLACKKKSSLSLQNLKKLQDALKRHLGFQAPQSWDDFQGVKASLERFYNPVSHTSRSFNDPFIHYTPQFDPFNLSSHRIKALYHASKARTYFEKHTAVPRWYHTTDINTVKLIIDSGIIENRHEGMYAGAWVSTEREPHIDRKGGDAVFIFSHAISDLDRNVSIKSIHALKRWRGLHCDIPILKSALSKDSHLILFGLGTKYSKQDKIQVKELLQKKGITQLHMLSLEGIDYIQKNIKKVIGNPNLTEKWWGKADVADLDKPL